MKRPQSETSVEDYASQQPADHDLESLKKAYKRAKTAYKCDKSNEELKKVMKMHKTKLREAEKIGAAITSSSAHDGDDVTEDPLTTGTQQDKTSSSSSSSHIERLEEEYQKALTAFKADKTNKDLRRAKTAARQALDSAITASQPKGSKQLTCLDCSRIFFFSKEDQKKHKKMKWNEMPKRCELCKSKRTERLANQRGKLDTKERNICYAFQALVNRMQSSSFLSDKKLPRAPLLNDVSYLFDDEDNGKVTLCCSLMIHRVDMKIFGMKRKISS